ncbi:E3 ubiquitin-protein ligase Topors-like [Balearica regulorum gibbericeps]|uniref:E3 ubiquitin-protein ligase Topors-like n=1 Tax=Balearica regulorum gibbericeps TaxID=100784 RepID=UPI003F5F6C32
METTATELDNCCPICLGSWEEASYVTPCLHQFCYPCILRWADSKPECPLCKRRILSITHSVQAGDDFEEHVITPFVASSVIRHQAGGAPGHPAAHSLRRLAATQPQPVGLVPRAPLGGLQPNTWASLFRDHPALLQPLLTWVRQELRQIFGNRHLQAATAEGLVLSLLVLFGLEEDLLVQLLRASLQNHTSTFVHQLMTSLCNGPVGRPTVCWAWRTAMLPEGRRAALWLPLAPLPPRKGLQCLARPTLSALKEPMRMTSPAPQQLPFVGVLAALPVPLFLSPGSKSFRRSLRRPRHVHLLPTGAGNGPLGSHSDPQRGGLAAPRPLLQPRRGCPTSNSRTTPEVLPKPGLG